MMYFHCLNITIASFGFFQEIKKVWAEHFTLVKHPNSKSPNGLQVQMVDSHDCSARKGGATLSPAMAVILSVCKLCTLICLRKSPCCTGEGKEAVDPVLESSGPGEQQITQEMDGCVWLFVVTALE